MRACCSSAGDTLKCLRELSSANFSDVLVASHDHNSNKNRSKLELMEISIEGDNVDSVGNAEYTPVEKKFGRIALLLLAITSLRMGMHSPSFRA